MSVKKHPGKRGVTWHIVLELGRDPTTGKRTQHRISRDPDTGAPIPTKTRALEIEREALVRHHRGGVLDHNLTPLADYLERWLAETADTRTGSTQYSWSIIVRTRVIPRIGAVPLGHLTALELHAFYRDLGKTYAPTTVSTTRAVLSGALKCAVRWRLLPHNPHEGVRLPKAPPATERPIWAADEVRRFLDATNDTRWGALWRLLYDSAMRIGEALALTWADIDWDAGTVRISKGVVITAGGSHGIANRTKSASGRRTLSLSDATLDALRRHRASQNARRLALGEYWTTLDLLWDRGDGVLINDAVLRDHFDRDVVAAGVARITIHGIRHSSLTLAVAAGEPLHAVSKRAGHATLAMTSDLYAHASPEADRRVSDALAKVLEG
jgi:integrase